MARSSCLECDKCKNFDDEYCHQGLPVEECPKARLENEKITVWRIVADSSSCYAGVDSLLLDGSVYTYGVISACGNIAWRSNTADIYACDNGNREDN